MPLTGTQWAASIEPLGVLNAAMVAGHASQLISDLTAAAQVATVAGRVVGNAFLLAMVEAEHIESWFEGSGNVVLSATARNMLIARGSAAYALALTI
jgi:hypothetical protein